MLFKKARSKRAETAEHLMATFKQEKRLPVPTINDFKLINRLGVGAFGKVYLAKKVGSGPDEGKIFAVKALLKSTIIKFVSFISIAFFCRKRKS